MKSFVLGESVRVDLATLIDTRLLVQANSGGGKSRTIRRLLEQTHGQVQHLVIDLEGEFASLREKFDYVVAAKGGDTPADPRSAALLAERLLELKVSAILDIYELKHHDRIRFVRLFLEALVNARKELWHPVLVVVDEAHTFCPQQGEAESASAVIDLCTRGRKRGFCAVLATQRLSKLHKDAAAECNNKLIGRSAMDVDMKRASDELGFTTKEQQLSLRTLDPGDFYAFGPALSRQVQLVHVGDVQTSHPKAGGRIAFTAPPPTAKVKALLPQLADLPAEVEQKQKTEAELRKDNADKDRRIRELEKASADSLHSKESARPEVKRVEVLTDADRALLESTAKRIGDIEGLICHGREQAVRALTVKLQERDEFWLKRVGQVLEGKGFQKVLAKLSTVEPAQNYSQIIPPKLTQENLSRRVAPPVATRRPAAQVDAQGDASIGNSGLRRMLIALAQRPQGLTRSQLGVRARVSTAGGSFNTYLSKARVNGWIDSTDHRIVITEAGLAALGSYEPLPEGPDLLAHYVREFGASGAARMLQALAAVYPQPLTRADLSAASGVDAAGGSFNTYLSKLRTLELVEGKSELRASAELFS